MSVNVKLSVLAGVAALFLQGQVMAAPISCTGTVGGKSYDLRGRVSTASDCYVAQASQDFVGKDPMTVNAEKFFGFSDWKFDGKMGEAGLSLANFTRNDGGQWSSGSYSLNPGARAYENIMFVFKSKHNLVAYLLKADSGAGSYTNPFTNPPFDFKGGQKEISHISVYYNGDGTRKPPGAEVPEPATAALLGLGAFTMLGLRRRRPLKG